MIEKQSTLILSFDDGTQVNLFPEGCIFNPILVNGKKNGVHDVLTKDGFLYARLPYKDDILEGVCEFYNNGFLKEKITYKNGKPNGWGCNYENNEESMWFFYKDGRKFSELKKNDDNFYLETEVRTGKLLSLCKYNENHEKDGIGYLYTNDVISEEIEFANGQRVNTTKKFEEKLMTIFNENNERVYEGGFVNDRMKGFPRNEKGREFKQGIVVYDGDWVDDKKQGEGTSYQNYRPLFKGHWQNDLPDGEGSLYDENGSVLIEGQWHKGKCKHTKGAMSYRITYTNEGVKKKAIQNSKTIQLEKKNTLLWKIPLVVLVLVILCILGVLVYLSSVNVSIKSKEDYDKLNRNVVSITIPSNSCNDEDFVSFELSNYPKLKKLVIGDHALKHAKRVLFDGLDLIEELTIGRDSFSLTTEGSLHISNCDGLRSFSAAPSSFTHFDVLQVESGGMIEI